MRITIISIAAVSVIAYSIQAAPQAELWPRWQSNDPESKIVLEHELWAIFLEQYLVSPHPSGINRVRYDAVNGAGRALLDRYIATLASISPSTLNRSEQLPYWINLYNALTVRLILDNLPIDSIRDIDDPWNGSIVTIDGYSLTLNDIEHRIIRPIWDDNRIHYLVNCASIGCPDLQPEPLTAANYDRLADRAAREYLSHPRGIRFERNHLVLSSLFNWYIDDFGGDRDSLIRHLSEYASPETARRLREYSGRIRYEYDWSLVAP